jgi:chaperonin GroEL
MSGKIVTFNPEAREKLIKGMNIVADAVAVTLGPKGRNVVIDTYGTPAVTKDGVTVAKWINLVEPVENLGAQLIKQAAARSGTNAGDGTTTATLLTQSLVQGGMELLKKGVSPIDVKRGYEELLNITLAGVVEAAVPVDDDKIKDISTISANNDKVIGSLIADAFKAVGKDGMLAVEDSRTNETFTKIVDGVSIPRGFLSPYFVTDPSKMETVYEDPYILITDKKIRGTQELVPILDKVISQSRRPLIIIADDVEAQALSLLVVNRVRQGLPVLAVKAPAYGERRSAILQDLAVLVGAELISEHKGLRLEDTTLEQLGSCKKVISNANETILVDPAGNKEEVAKRATEVRAALDNSTNEYEKEKLTERLAKLVAKVAVLYVGAATETEVKEKKDRIDDAIRATRAAIARGYVPGGGSTLLDISSRLQTSSSQEVLDIFVKALQSPTSHIVKNAGGDPSKIIPQIIEMLKQSKNAGYDASALRFEKDMVKVGIIDPALVVEEALVNAVSAANMLILSEVTIHDVVEKYEPMSPEQANMMAGSNPYDV